MVTNDTSVFVRVMVRAEKRIFTKIHISIWTCTYMYMGVHIYVYGHIYMYMYRGSRASVS